MSRFSLKVRIMFVLMILLVPILTIVGTYIIPLITKRMMADREQKTKAAVEIAFNIAKKYYSDFEKGTITEKEAQSKTIEVIQSLRYENVEYFWVNDLQPKMIVHPIKPELNGTDISQIKDPNGVFLFNEMVTIAKKSGQGFVNYSWPKPGSNNPEPKVSYVQLFKPWGWIFGTGVYVDDIEKDIRGIIKNVTLSIGTVVLIALAISLLITHRMSQNIESVSQDLTHVSQNLAQSFNQLKGVGEGLSTASTQTAASLEETVASLEELTSMVETNTKSAQNASQKAKTTESSVITSKNEISDLIQAMSQIKGSSHKIKEIIDVIDDIAFQTNLLALNASVEAARAGEQGKGFAVVAEAVRSLAQRSALAAKDISTLIHTSVNQIEQGSKIAETSGTLFSTILENVQKTSELNGSIADASIEQNQGIHQITAAMNQLDQAAQVNAATAEELSATTLEINEVAIKVRSLTEDLQKVVRGRI